MLQDTLIVLEKILEKKTLNTIQREKLIKLFKSCRPATQIYPGVFARKAEVSVKDIYLILDELEKLHIVSAHFEIICCECNRTIGNDYRSISDIPDKVYCENCNNEMEGMNNAFLVYKVNRPPPKDNLKR